MSKIDVRLQYQKDSGDSLDTINRNAEEDPYIEWLEETVERLQKGVDAWGSANIIATAAQNAVKKQK